MEKVILVDESKCTGCGLCNEVCTRKLFKYDGVAKIDANKVNCMMCNQCVAICPVGALSAAEGDEPIEYNKETMSVNPENMLGMIKFRRSTRAFLDKKVEKEKIQRILDAGTYAPTGNNRALLRYVVLDENVKEFREAFLYELKRVAEQLPPGSPLISAPTDEQREAKRQRMMRFYDIYQEKGEDKLSFSAPCMVIMLADKAQGGRPLWDSGIASGYMELQAVSEGLGLCYLGFSMTALENSKELQEKIGMKENEMPAGIFVVGYPKYKYRRTAPRVKTPTTWW